MYVSMYICMYVCVYKCRYDYEKGHSCVNERWSLHGQVVFHAMCRAPYNVLACLTHVPSHHACPCS